jgi:hypothetical protein
VTNYTATERCSCGATITTNAYTEDRLSKLLVEWRETHRHAVGIFMRDDKSSTEPVGEPEPESSRPERELLAELFLYVDFGYCTRQLTETQRDLWADCIDEWDPDPDNPEAREPIQRWWRE